MIIEALLNLIITVLTAPLLLINIPQIPTDIMTTVSDVITSMITYASNLIDLVMPYSIAARMLVIVIAIDIGVEIYHFVMWILRKIPMLGIE